MQDTLERRKAFTQFQTLKQQVIQSKLKESQSHNNNDEAQHLKIGLEESTKKTGHEEDESSGDDDDTGIDWRSKGL